MESKAKRPAFQFYGGDWLRAPELRSCSLSARGLWIDMIAIMSQASGHAYGHLALLVDGEHGPTLRAISPAGLARMVGSTAREVKKLLREIESFGVFSRTSDGIIYSRRMVRDERLRNVRAAGGEKSLENPNVPQRKDSSGSSGRIPLPPSSNGSLEDQPKDVEDGSLCGSSGGSPAFAFAFASLKTKTLSADAERVYAAYPKKVGKAAALKAIKEALKKVSVALLLERVTAYAQQCEKKQREQQFIPHPAKWFKEERWEDEDLRPFAEAEVFDPENPEHLARLPIAQAQWGGH